MCGGRWGEKRKGGQLSRSGKCVGGLNVVPRLKPAEPCVSGTNMGFYPSGFY